MFVSNTYVESENTLEKKIVSCDPTTGDTENILVRVTAVPD